jgi:hypothetical protein
MTRGSTCLVNGKHTPGSQWERECPLRTAAERSERSRRAAVTRRGRAGGGVAGVGRPQTKRMLQRNQRGS